MADPKGLGLSVLAVLALCAVGAAPAARAQDAAAGRLTDADVSFLGEQCQIDPADIGAISRLEAKTQAALKARISRRDCALIGDFVEARRYYRALDINKRVPLPPMNWYKGELQYLTEDEYKAYMNIMNNAPW